MVQDISENDDTLLSLISEASKSGDVRAISFLEKLLIERKQAEINKETSDPYHETIDYIIDELEEGNLNPLKLFAGRIIDPNIIVDSDGTTLLMVAAGIGSYDAVNHLIGCGADVNILTEDSSCALDVAIVNNHMDIVEYLEELTSPSIKEMIQARRKQL